MRNWYTSDSGTLLLAYTSITLTSLTITGILLLMAASYNLIMTGTLALCIEKCYISFQTQLIAQIIQEQK